jgi:hypothetical protein
VRWNLELRRRHQYLLRSHFRHGRVTYRPVAPLILRAEYRYDKSDKNVFLFGDRATNHQQTMAFQVIYLF